MKTKKIAALTIAATMSFTAMSNVYAAADKTLNMSLDTVYSASDLCPDGASYLNSITSWSDVNETVYESIGVDFGDVTSFTTYAVNGLNTELIVNASVDGIYQLNLLTVKGNWWMYPAVYLGENMVANGTDGGFINRDELSSTFATFNSTNNVSVAKTKLTLSEGENKIKITGGGDYEGLTGLVAAKLTLLSKSTFTTDEIIKGDNITRGDGRASYCHTVNGGYTATDNFKGELAEVFGSAANIGDKYNNYTDDTATYKLNVTTPGRYKVYVLGTNGTDTQLTYTNESGHSVSTHTEWTGEYWNNAVFTAGNTNVFVMACEVELGAGKYTVSLDNYTNNNYFTDFVALGMKLMDSTPSKTLPTVATANVGTFTNEGSTPASAFTGSFTVSEDNYAVSGVKWTVGSRSDTVSFTEIASGTVVVGLIVEGEDAANVKPDAVTIAADAE